VKNKHDIKFTSLPFFADILFIFIIVKYIAEGAELDRVERAEKLDHVTALRVKAPKRRPPSSIFLKDNVSTL
jgi:hypothetical protein